MPGEQKRDPHPAIEHRSSQFNRRSLVDRFPQTGGRRESRASSEVSVVSLFLSLIVFSLNYVFIRFPEKNQETRNLTVY